MKRILPILLCLSVTLSAMAQKDGDEKEKFNSGRIARLDQADRLMVTAFTDIWITKPHDSVMSIKSINMGTNTSLFRDIPLGKSNFSFAVGAGISCHNLYSDAVPQKETIMDTNGVWSFTGNTVLAKIPSTISGNEISVKNNKLTVVYIDIPVEFRFRTRNEGQKFKVALGFKFGYMISSHTKYRGSDIVYDYASQDWDMHSGETIKVKYHKVPYIESYRFGPTFRAGWGWVNLFAYYSLTDLFKKDKAPELSPLSVGISITPL